MPRYQIYYLRDSQLDSYRRGAPKPKGLQLHRRHYEQHGEIEADSPYAAWESLQGEEAHKRGIRPLGVGDALQMDTGGLMVCNYWGFDTAEWHSDKPKSPGEPNGTTTAADPSSATAVQEQPEQSQPRG